MSRPSVRRTLIFAMTIALAAPMALAADRNQDFGQIRPEDGTLRAQNGSGNGDFGDNIAGAYLGEVALPNGFVLLRFTIAIHADGTWSSSDASDHTGLYNDTPITGAWTKTGPRQITVRGIGFYADPLSENGAIEGVYRIEGSIDFERQFDSATGAYAQQIFAPEQVFSPLAPNTDAPPLEETPPLPFRIARIVPAS